MRKELKFCSCKFCPTCPIFGRKSVRNLASSEFFCPENYDTGLKCSDYTHRWSNVARLYIHRRLFRNLCIKRSHSHQWSSRPTNPRSGVRTIRDNSIHFVSAIFFCLCNVKYFQKTISADYFKNIVPNMHTV